MSCYTQGGADYTLEESWEPTITHVSRVVYAGFSGFTTSGMLKAFCLSGREQWIIWYVDVSVVEHQMRYDILKSLIETMCQEW